MTARNPLVVASGMISELPSGDTLTGYVASTTITKIVVLTQAAYDALSPPASDTLYLISG